MKKDGYLIAKNSIAKTYFTSSSSYDRAVFVEAAKATNYLTVEMAQSALKKLLNNGIYTARIVPLSEAFQFELPADQDAPAGDINREQGDQSELPPNEGNEDEDENEDEMMAQDQSGDPDAPPVGDGNPGDEAIESEVDQLLGNESDPDIAASVDQEQLDVDPESGDSVMAATPSDGAEREQFGDPSVSDEFSDEDEDEDAPDLLGGVKESMLGMTQIPTMAVSNPASEPHADSPVSQALSDKVKVPADLMSSLGAVKAEYERQAKYAGTNDDARSFAMTVVGSMEELMTLMKQGDVAGIKAAQLKLTSFMSPIMHLVPDPVVKFLAMGGRKPTLKDLYNRFK